MAENEQPTEYEDEEPQSGVFRWMSTLVVIAAIAGFLGLAWYAYKSGGENVDEKDVELIKADTTPVKEAPANPGGMEIPHQDKTVYGLINGEHTDNKPTVERILPAPEEPVTHPNETETWMSDKVKSKTEGTAEEKSADPATSAAIASAVMGDSAPPPATPTPAPAPQKEQFNPKAASAKTTPAPIAIAAVEPATTTTPAPATPAPVTPPPVKVAAKAPAPAPASVPAPVATPLPKGIRVQLGAYKSQKDAKSDWDKISDTYSDELGKRQYYIVRVELSKGTFYRLQVGPFASTKEGEQFCLGLVSDGQSCMIARDK